MKTRPCETGTCPAAATHRVGSPPGRPDVRGGDHCQVCAERYRWCWGLATADELPRFEAVAATALQEAGDYDLYQGTLGDTLDLAGTGPAASARARLADCRAAGYLLQVLPGIAVRLVQPVTGTVSVFSPTVVITRSGQSAPSWTGTPADPPPHSAPSPPSGPPKLRPRPVLLSYVLVRTDWSRAAQEPGPPRRSVAEAAMDSVPAILAHSRVPKAAAEEFAARLRDQPIGVPLTQKTTSMTFHIEVRPALDPPGQPAPDKDPIMKTPALEAHLVGENVTELLSWSAQHTDPEVRAQGDLARTLVVGLSERRSRDTELARVTTEAEELETRLAELRARQAELTPAKAPAKRRRIYDAPTVRAWARTNGIDVPDRGHVPNAVLDAWLARDTAADPPAAVGLVARDKPFGTLWGWPAPDGGYAAVHGATE
jgi:hypothetical protein